MDSSQIPLIEDYLRSILSVLQKLGSFSVSALFNEIDDFCILKIEKLNGGTSTISIKCDDPNFDSSKYWLAQTLVAHKQDIEPGITIFNKDISILVMEKSAANWDEFDVSQIRDLIRNAQYLDTEKRATKYLN